MPGNRGRVGLILQERDEQLFKALRTLQVLDCAQVRKLIEFPSVRRTNARLLELTKQGYLRRLFLGAFGSGRRAVYRLASASGRGSPAHLLHQLAIADVYLWFRAAHGKGVELRRWQTFGNKPPAAGIPLIPDGYAEVTGAPAVFVEVDRGTESSRVWQEKARNYEALALSGEFERVFEQPRFRVAVITTSRRRIENLRLAVRKVTTKFFWFATFEIIHRETLLSPSWLRPEGDEMVPLM